MGLPVHLLWLIPLLPLLTAGVTALLPGAARKPAARMAIAALGVSFLLSCGALVTALRDPAAHAFHNFTWLEVGSGALRLGWLLDPLTALMCVMVTFVGLLIFIFSAIAIADRLRKKA